MTILAVDTSGPCAGAAVWRDGAIAAETTVCAGLTHSETSLPMIEDVLSRAGLTTGDVDLFAAVTGPGSFTGVRIGVCEVKGLAHATGRQVVGVDALETLSVNAFGFKGVICPILDARRGQVYAAAFRFNEGERPVRLMDDQALPLPDYLAALPEGERCLFLGDGLSLHFPAVRAVLGERAICAPAPMAHLRAASAAFLAALDAERALPPERLEPLYLRAPQAERERARRLQQEG